MWSSMILKKMTIGKHFSRKIFRQFPVRPNSNLTKTRFNSSFGHFIKRTLFGITAGAIAYDGYNEFQVYGGITRFMRSLKVAALISIDYSWHLSGLTDKHEEYERILKETHARSAQRLLNGCLANGGLYIKIGQGVSAINHILPYEYTNTLKKLENECLPRKVDEVKRVFEVEFGQPPEELFEEFEYEPIAAASLAQVFRAKTKDGHDVAVKVQYIDLINRFSGDFTTILCIQELIKLIHKNYNFGWILRDLRKNLEQELDFVHEGKNSEKCAVELAKFSFVHVPTVEWKLTSKRVLTTEWIDGYKISDLDNIKNDKFDIADIDKKMFKIFSEQIFNTGFVHADPHPGNVFLRKKKNGKPEIVLLDHGLYEHLSSSTRLSLCQFWEAIVLKDQAKMDKYSKELHVNDSNKLAEILMQRPINMSKPTFTTRLTDEDIAYFQADAKRHFDIVLETLKQMPRQMLFVIRNLNTIRAIARHHGDPVDRQTFMAKYAQRCIYNTTNFNFFQKIKWIIRRIKFDFHLAKISFQFWFVRKYLDTLKLFGRSQVDSNAILNYANEI